MPRSNRDPIKALATVVVVFTLLFYLGGTREERAQNVPPSNVDELDPKRWAHDGTQPTEWKTGNARAVEDDAVSSMLAHVSNY